MRDLIILAKSLCWAAALGILVFILFFLGPLIVGGPGAHQGPLAAFVFAPFAFFLIFIIAFLIQIRRELDPSPLFSKGKKIIYFALLVLALLSISPYASFFSGMLKSIQKFDFKSYTKKERLKHIPPLTEEERQVLQSTHFNIRVGVVNPHFTPTYTSGLINELKKTGLFDEVARLEWMDKIDLIATVMGTTYGDKRGVSFSLQKPDGLSSNIHVDVYYTPGGLQSHGEEHKQYLDRLSIEIIKAVQLLSLNEFAEKSHVGRIKEQVDKIDRLTALKDICPVYLYQEPERSYKDHVAWCSDNSSHCLTNCLDGGPNYCAGLAKFFQNQGIARDYPDVLYAEACRLGLITACTNRAVSLMIYGGNEYQYQVCNATTFEFTCNKNDAWGCTMYGLLLSRGIGIEQDFKLAHIALMAGCKQGREHPACQRANEIVEEITSAKARAQAIASSNKLSFRDMNDLVWGDNQFVAVGAYGLVLTSPDGSVWKVQRKKLSIDWYGGAANEWFGGVAWGKGRYVAVGLMGIILTSTDGETWNERRPLTIAGTMPRQIAWINNQFVAVGGEGLILTSPDGIDWVRVESGTTENLVGITGGNGKFVAVGKQGTIVTSSNGKEWTSENLEGARFLNSVAWSGQEFVAVGALYHGSVIARSTDGQNWQVLVLKGDRHQLFDITWSGNHFVAVGNGIYISSDGKEWAGTKNMGYLQSFKRVSGGNGKYVALSSSGGVYVSNNGINWRGGESISINLGSGQTRIPGTKSLTSSVLSTKNKSNKQKNLNAEL